MCEYVQTTYDLQDALELCGGGVGWGGVEINNVLTTTSLILPWQHVIMIFILRRQHVSWSSNYADNMLKYLDTTSWGVLKNGFPSKWTCSGQSSPRGEGMSMAMASQQKGEYTIPHWLQNSCAKTLDGCASGVPEVRKWRCGPQAMGHGVTWVVSRFFVCVCNL